MRDKTKVKKKVNKLIASAGDAEAGKEGFGKDMEGKWVGNGQGSSTPSLILRMGGRIVCASRHPPRHLKAGGLEALSLEGFEVLAVLSIDWLVGWLIVCLASVT